MAAWLPGSEGAGIADVLVGDTDGTPRHDFTGALSFSWPKRADQASLNVGDADYDPLFAYGYGLSYADEGALGALSIEAGIAETDVGLQFMRLGDAVDGWQFALRDGGGEVRLDESRGQSPAGSLTAEPRDRDIQEDTVLLTWTDAASFALVGSSVNLLDEANQNMVLELAFMVVGIGDDPVKVGLGGAEIDVTQRIITENEQGWKQMLLPLSCFADAGGDLASVSEPLSVSAGASLQLQLSSARVVATLDEIACE